MRRFRVYKIDQYGNVCGPGKELNEDEYLADALNVVKKNNRLRRGLPKRGEIFIDGMGRLRPSIANFTPDARKFLILDPHPDTLKPKDPLKAHLANMPVNIGEHKCCYICKEVQDWMKEHDRLVREKGDDT